MFGCSKIVSINIPNSVNVIGISAFKDCSNLIYVNIPNSVASIGGFAFEGCTNLGSITLPNTVEDIGFGAFRDCPSLKSVISLNEEPCVISGSFELAPSGMSFVKTLTLYVPFGSKEKYELFDDANYWSFFQNIVEMAPGEDEKGKFLPPTDLSESDDDTPVEMEVWQCPNAEQWIGGDGGYTDVIIDNIYYNLDEENGDGFSEEDDYLVLNTPVSMNNLSAIEGKFVGATEIAENYHGLIFKVPEGSGIISIDVTTLGIKQLGVKVGSNAPQTFSQYPRGKVEVPYNVAEPTYIYIYATNINTSAKGIRKAVANDEGVQLYGIEWKSALPDGIESVNSNSPAEVESIYSANGTKIATLQRGINVVKMSNGQMKKVVVK